MSRDETIAALEDFLRRVRAYADLIGESSDQISFRVTRNIAEIDNERGKLAQTYACLEKWIARFGNKPRMGDGVWNVAYSPYANAFTSDTLARVEPSLGAVIDDLNVALGRLKATTDQDFNDSLRCTDETEIGAEVRSQGSLWNYSNPFWLGWQLLRLLWRHKVVSGICTAVIAPLIVAYVLHWFGWH